MRYDCLIGGLVFANRPDVYRLIGSVGGGGGQFSDLMPALRAVFNIFSQSEDEMSTTANDFWEILQIPALNEDDAMVTDALWAEASPKIFGVRPRDRTQKIKWDILSKELSREGVVLAELQKQVEAYQVAVKSWIIFETQKNQGVRS